MSIVKWDERDVTIPVGEVVAYNTKNLGANIVQIINRTASGGGSVFVDNKASNVSESYHSLKVEQGKTGNIVRPYGIQTVYLASNAVADLRVTLIEVEASDLSVVYNASQVVQIQGQVEVAEPVTIDGTVAVSGSVEIKNDIGSPIPVSGTMTIDTINGTVEITNDAGNPIPVSGSVTISDGSGPVTVDGTVTIGAGTNNIGDVDVLTLPTVTLAGKSAVKVTAAGDTTVKAAAGVFYDVIVLTAGVTATVKDAAVEKWAASDTIHQTPGAPIAHATSIVVTLSGAGTAYVIFE